MLVVVVVVAAVINAIAKIACFSLYDANGLVSIQNEIVNTSQGSRQRKILVLCQTLTERSVQLINTEYFAWNSTNGFHLTCRASDLINAIDDLQGRKRKK